MIKKYNKLLKIDSKLKGAIGELEASLFEHIAFEFSISELPGDGYCVLNAETSDVAPVIECIKFILKNGVLTVEDHKRFCI